MSMQKTTWAERGLIAALIFLVLLVAYLTLWWPQTKQAEVAAVVPPVVSSPVVIQPQTVTVTSMAAQSTTADIVATPAPVTADAAPRYDSPGSVYDPKPLKPHHRRRVDHSIAQSRVTSWGYILPNPQVWN